MDGENLAWMVQVPPRSWRAIQSQGKFPKQVADSQDHQPGQKLGKKLEVPVFDTQVPIFC